MTRQDLVVYFDDYRKAFPEWNVKHGVCLFRSAPPIEQRIDFQPLRAGSYRPSCSIHVQGPGVGFQLLNRWLDAKNEQVWPREHETKFRQVLKAMEEQFVPSIRHALRLSEVIRLAEADVATGDAGNIQYCAGLAVLNAYVGALDRASLWCRRAADQLKALGRPPATWEITQHDFALQLQGAIDAGDVLQFLHTTLRE